MVNISNEIKSDVNQVSEAVARNLKEQRRNHKLSLEQLSRRCGVSKGMLSEIESGKANPSIAVLCRISAALGLSVADLVDVSEPLPVHVIQASEIPNLWAGPGGGSARLLSGTSGPNMVELWKWELFPGERFESQAHPPHTMELFHVESGTLTLGVQNREFVIPAGCSAVAKTDVSHTYRNAHDALLVFYMTVAELHDSP